MRRVVRLCLAYVCCLVGCPLVILGCSTLPPTRLYILTPVSVQEQPASRAKRPDMAIGVGPVELPQYTHRPQIVTGNTQPEIYGAVFAQWAEPLQESFTRVLAENLSRLLGTDRVAIFPWKGSTPYYQVVVEVTHLLGDLGGEVVLVALWSILSQESKEALVSKKLTVREPTSAPGYAPLALAMSRTVAGLSQEISAALAVLPGP